jgi:hypothetical protein
MGYFAEHPIRRLLGAIGGALVSIFGPSVVPMKYQPWLVALGVLIVFVAIIWPYLERWPGRFLKTHVAWRFQLRPPTQTATPAKRTKTKATEPDAPQGPILAPPPPPPQEEQPPLSERERGFCKNALIKVGEFLRTDLTTLHYDLAATQKPENQSGLAAKISSFQIRAAQAHEAARRLHQDQWTWLHRMRDDLDLTQLLELLAELQRKIAAVKQGIDHGFAASALMECLRPMYAQNVEVGRTGKGLIEAVEQAEAEFFGG